MGIGVEDVECGFCGVVRTLPHEVVDQWRSEHQCAEGVSREVLDEVGSIGLSIGELIIKGELCKHYPRVAGLNYDRYALNIMDFSGDPDSCFPMLRATKDQIGESHWAEYGDFISYFIAWKDDDDGSVYVTMYFEDPVNILTVVLPGNMDKNHISICGPEVWTAREPKIREVLFG